MMSSNKSQKKIAEILAQMPTRGLWFTKRALNRTFNNSFKKQLQLEDELQQEAAATDDFKEGVKAFLEKRTARFLWKVDLRCMCSKTLAKCFKSVLTVR
jgi:enoyl-CoA hydratase/carnithine racemase